MSTVVPCIDYRNISIYNNIGISNVSLDLKKYYSAAIKQFRKTETLWPLDELHQRLDEVFEECSQEGWDGYDAIPISEAAYHEAKKLIERIPVTIIPMPELIPEPNGEIAFEWYRGSRKIFVASVSGKNEIIYAGLFGINKTHGTEFFGDNLPFTILNNLIRLYHQELICCR